MLKNKELYIYNTLTRKKEKFEPLHPGRVNIYVCGPTVYGDAHLGHAKSYISFDVIIRYFRYLGYKVKYVQNITDVGHLTDNADEGEDKLEQKARQEKLDPMQIAQSYTWSYFDDMDALKVRRPDISPHATGHIPEQIRLTQQLLNAGYAYEVNGSVYFDVTKYPKYGQLSGRRLEDLEAGSRIEVNSEKKDPRDFALWKKADPSHLMQWDSPWGRGYPGWHIECSAMSMKYLGETFDIHGGGLENIFPHHECEIAQSEAATGRPFVRYWMHNNMVTVNGVKMGKSLGNFITIKETLQKYSPETIRYFVLSSHYRSPLDFSDRALEAAEKGLTGLIENVGRLEAALQNAEEIPDSTPPFNPDVYYRKFEEAMSDDFNTPRAIAVLFDLNKELTKLLASDAPRDAGFLRRVMELYRTLGGEVLGIIPDRLRQESNVELENLAVSLVELLLDIRTELRKEKLWALSDQIRDRLIEMGISIADLPDGKTTYTLPR